MGRGIPRIGGNPEVGQRLRQVEDWRRVIRKVKLSSRLRKKGPEIARQEHRLKSVPPVISNLQAHGGTGFNL
jgi:hypothetical protein